ncbi:MAG TPA: hypothetical protein DDX47_05530 [Candidatus Jacksonbacteria bacterium]|nr:MAG: hypothetical protein UW45_C0020G0006 [Parcubacteria group bacterium GW2011_GWC2_44_22]HBH46792.1 hypothetical protein [Candidatus Jacksonbacteria bacterium]HCC49483.1 hypothetical protein [Candidatus Jacksonbacteria bacterium]HCE48927.1 hypothetical protein [Candidatus Jacksonbacteria bacterium]HCR14731.1 hypothetical protein [Candidatus Jacksonbacteria bacterium]
MKIVLVSFGKRYVEIQGPAFEVDTWLEDPVGKLPDKPGTDPEISEALLKDLGMQAGLEKAKALISEQLEKLKSVSVLVKVVKFYFRCMGGFQRSVVAAEAIGAWLREQGHEVEVIHLTMDLALALKTGSYLEEEKK